MPRTLVIDDDPDTEIFLRTQLDMPHSEAGGGGYSFARSDDEAIAIIESGREFDIALVAIDRAEISGMSLFRKLEDRSFRVPRIALSVGANLNLIRRAMNEGAIDFLIKPFTAEDFTITIERVISEVERRRKNWRDRAEFSALRKEIDIAAEIQKRILPTEFPAVDGLEIHAAMKPAKVMGGDFYDVFDIDDDTLGFVIADVAGKGVPAAFYMAVARTLLRSVALRGVSPDDCLTQANELLCEHHIPGMFISVFYGVLDIRQWRFTFSNGGHQLPYLTGNSGRTTALGGASSGGGTVLGVVKEQIYTSESVELSPGDSVYFYTDGVTEAFNAERVAFTEARLEANLMANAGKSAQALNEGIAEAIDAFVGDAEQHDDITSMIFKRN